MNIPYHLFFGSQGQIKVAENGNIIESSPDYKFIKRVNIDEWSTWCRSHGQLPDDDDILCVGYWYDDPDGTEQYEPPEEDFRTYGVGDTGNYANDGTDLGPKPRSSSEN